MQEKPMSSPRYGALLSELKRHPSLLIAFSGGVDSSLLLYAAAEALGKNRILAVTALAQTYPEREREEAAAFCRAYGFAQKFIHTDEVGTINARGNPFDRCYHCKRELFQELVGLARAEGLAAVAEGANLDDDGDYRPGRRAIAELGIISPLKAAGLAKQDIRDISRTIGLPTWDKPACACLVSRFPYKVEITADALTRIERAEEYVRALGFRLCRVRHYGDRARLEVAADRVVEAVAARERISAFFSELGYAEVEIDPRGYRTGSMNVFG
jgi:pyridinium-3,5-biscarboxylic acid mononucleotide sulfurtransferase